jgi:hypothetical protein
MDVGLVGRPESVIAMRTGGKRGLDGLVRVLAQRAGYPGAAGAGRLIGAISQVAFWPFEGGRLELSGVFGGAASLAARSAMRAVRTLICCACASILGSSPRTSLRMLRQDQRDQVITGKGEKGCVVHASP